MPVRFFETSVLNLFSDSLFLKEFQQQEAQPPKSSM
jgi:hypothetical protein